jgi:hypothetical protein
LLTACHVAERRRRENDDAFTGSSTKEGSKNSHGVTANAIQDDKLFSSGIEIRGSVVECGGNPESFRETPLS